MAIVAVEKASKYYGDIKALDSLNLEIPEGSIFCLLGPNGAGKTTLVKALLGLIPLNSGKATIGGIDIRSPRARADLAYLPEKFSFYPYYTVGNLLAFYSSMGGVKGENIRGIIERMGLESLEKTPLKKLSKGQLQRAALASTLCGKKKLLILDEPFTGLDPIGINDLKSLLTEIKDEGRTVFINTHLLGEVSSLCETMAVINRGKKLCQGQKNDLLKGLSLEEFFYQKVKGHESL